MGSVWAQAGLSSPAVQQSAMAINDITIDFVIKALSDTGSVAPHFVLLAKDRERHAVFMFPVPGSQVRVHCR